jgi:hypothetical protein
MEVIYKSIEEVKELLKSPRHVCFFLVFVSIYNFSLAPYKESCGLSKALVIPLFVVALMPSS